MYNNIWDNYKLDKVTHNLYWIKIAFQYCQKKNCLSNQLNLKTKSVELIVQNLDSFLWGNGHLVFTKFIQRLWTSSLIKFVTNQNQSIVISKLEKDLTIYHIANLLNGINQLYF
jgi:hypothetical protein